MLSLRQLVWLARRFGCPYTILGVCGTTHADLIYALAFLDVLNTAVAISRWQLSPSCPGRQLHPGHPAPDCHSFQFHPHQLKRASSRNPKSSADCGLKDSGKSYSSVGSTKECELLSSNDLPVSGHESDSRSPQISSTTISDHNDKLNHHQDHSPDDCLVTCSDCIPAESVSHRQSTASVDDSRVIRTCHVTCTSRDDDARFDHSNSVTHCDNKRERTSELSQTDLVAITAARCRTGCDESNTDCEADITISCCSG